MNIFEIIPWQYILLYFMFINIISFLMFFFDKIFAMAKKRRISEKALLIVCLIGGSIGGIIGMYKCRHKIRKYRFKFGIPIIIIVQILLIVYYLYTLYM